MRRILAFTKRVGPLAAGLVIGQAVLYVCTPVLSRLYGPEAFGRAQLFLAVMSIVATLATLRFETQIAKADDDDAIRAARIALIAAALISTAAVPCFRLVTGEWVVSLLLAGSILAMAVTLVLTQYAARNEQLNALAVSKAVQGSLQAGVPLGAAGPLRGIGLELGIGVSYAAAATIQVFGLHEARRIFRIKFKLSLRRFFHVRLRTALTLTLSAGANVLVVWNAPVVIESLSGAREVGLAAMAQRMVAVPIGILVAAIAPVVIGWVARKLRLGEDPIGPLKALFFPLSIGGLVIVGVLVAIPDHVWSSILGNEWTGVGRYLAAYAPYIYGLILVGPFGQLIAVFGRSRVQLLWDVSRLGAILLVAFFATIQGWSAIVYLWWANGILCAFYIIYVVILLPEIRPARQG